jgi:hypothetical protein
MELRFRQGLVRYQTDVAGTANFIRKNGSNSSFVDLVCDNAPTVLTVAHQENNYLVQFDKTVQSYWGPFPATGQTQYLYWDISLLNAAVTPGFTTVVPHIGPTAPSGTSPLDKHWFDTTSKQMKVWNGMRWLVKLRVFAATYDSSAILVPRVIGTQVGLNVSCRAGNILTGKNNHPLKDGDGTFVTSETDLVVTHTTGENVRFDTAQLYAEVVEFVPKFTLVSYINPRKVQRASYANIDLRVNGLMREEYYTGEVGTVTSFGLIRNDQWNFQDTDINRPLFCGQFGEVTMTAPPIGVCQEIGYVYDRDAIFMNIQLPIIL